MTLEEYKNEIKELKERLEKLEAEKVEGQQPKRWKPENTENYWAIDSYGNVDDTTWDDDGYDNWQYISGNCFKTKDQAEEHKKHIEYTTKYKNYVEEHSDPIDWDNVEQGKYYVCFLRYSPTTSERVNKIIVTCTCWGKNQGTIFASNEKIIWDAIEEIGEDNFKKYVLEVE